MLNFSKSARGRNSGVSQCLRDDVVVRVGIVWAEPLLQAELLLEGVVEPETRRRAAEEIVVLREDAPDLARIGRFCLPSIWGMPSDSSETPCE